MTWSHLQITKPLDENQGDTMNEHFIKNIEIKNFKCFQNFKAEGFGRVNLIGGKNNVGKTAFMEACYLNTISSNAKEYIIACSSILTFGDYINIIKTNMEIHIEFFLQYPRKKLVINTNKNKTSYENKEKNSINTTEIFDINGNKEEIERGTLKELTRDELSKKKNHFIPSSQIENDYLNDLHDQIRLDLHEEDLNNCISTLFGTKFKKFLMREKKPLIYNNEEWQSLSFYGDGIKRFISMVSALYASKDGYLYLDEIENGIHYTNLDKLWEIILTISKEQNVQVFATTHSKECIESYARVAKKLEDEDIKFLSLYRNKENELKSITFDYEKIQDRIELGLDNR